MSTYLPKNRQYADEDSWTAICRGAVIHGLMAEALANELSVKVEARVARMSCGIVTQCSWKEGRYLSTDKVWSSDWHEWKANNQMSWFLKCVSPAA